MRRSFASPPVTRTGPRSSNDSTGAAGGGRRRRARTTRPRGPAPAQTSRFRPVRPTLRQYSIPRRLAGGCALGMPLAAIVAPRNQDPRRVSQKSAGAFAALIGPLLKSNRPTHGHMLRDGVTVARLTLDQLVLVRIQVPQPKSGAFV